MNVAPLPKVDRRPYPTGPEGDRLTLSEMSKRIREGTRAPSMRAMAGNILKTANASQGARVRVEALRDHVRKSVLYAPDAPMAEVIQAAHLTLCAEGSNALCIPIGDCFPRGTLLLRDDFEFVPVEQIKVGERIWGYDRWTRVEATAPKGVLNVDAVELNNGSTVCLTPNHKVYVGKCRHKRLACPICRSTDRSVGGYERVRVRELSEGSTLLRPERIDFGFGEVDPDRLYVEGLTLADGWVRDNLKCFYVSGRDGMRKEKQKHEVEEICARLGIKTRWHRRYIVIYDVDWAKRIAGLGERARFKHAETLNLTERCAAALLRGIMADSTPSNPKLPDAARTFNSTSHKMALQVRVLHRMFGQSMSCRMLTPEQHGGAGRYPLWRLGQRGIGAGRQEKSTLVRSIDRSVRRVSCWDIQTEDRYVYLPEHDITVSNCDDLTVALGSLIGAAGIDEHILALDYGPGIQPHVMLEFLDDGGQWLTVDPSPPYAPIGYRPHAKYTMIDPFDAAAAPAGFGHGEFVGVGVTAPQAIAYQQVTLPAAAHTGLRYRVGMMLTTSSDPTDNYRLEVERRSYFDNQGWYIESFEPQGAAQHIPGLDQWVQTWIMQALATREIPLTSDSYVQYMVVGVQSSTATPAAPAAPIVVAPIATPDVGWSFAKGLAAAAAIGVTAGVGWHLWHRHSGRP